MGDPNYEERRARQAEREAAEQERSRKREAREEAGNALFDVMAPSLKDFFEGKAHLIVETVDDNTRRVTFIKAS